MNKKILLWSALVFPIVILLIWTASLQLRLSQEDRVYITVDGYDPRNLISGHYLQLQVDWEKTDCLQFPAKQCPQEIFESYYQFYVPESIAAEMEKLIIKKRPLMQLEFVLNQGSPLIRNLYLDKVSWSTWYQEQMKKAEK